MSTRTFYCYANGDADGSDGPQTVIVRSGIDADFEGMGEALDQAEDQYTLPVCEIVLNNANSLDPESVVDRYWVRFSYQYGWQITDTDNLLLFTAGTTALSTALIDVLALSATTLMPVVEYIQRPFTGFWRDISWVGSTKFIKNGGDITPENNKAIGTSYTFYNSMVIDRSFDGDRVEEGTGVSEMDLEKWRAEYLPNGVYIKPRRESDRLVFNEQLEEWEYGLGESWFYFPLDSQSIKGYLPSGYETVPNGQILAVVSPPDSDFGVDLETFPGNQQVTASFLADNALDLPRNGTAIAAFYWTAD
jgi:hypothetical protein